jgi:lipoprotein-anchoring transpeptidase ErfK/SrfK
MTGSRVLLVLALAALAGGCGSTHRAQTGAPVGSPPPETIPRSSPSTIAKPGFSIIATARHGRAALYRSPRSRRAFRVQGAPDRRFPLVLLVRQAIPGWLQVYLPVRPNHSTAWIREAGAKISYDPYRVGVNLHRHRLLLWRGNRLVARHQIGVGKIATPTPPGTYYVIQLFRLSDPGGPFGPYALGLSAYSSVLESFGGGPGQIALHGTDDPGSIGSNLSHGCIHLRNDEIARLARLLPLGTPVEISV